MKEVSPIDTVRSSRGSGGLWSRGTAQPVYSPAQEGTSFLEREVCA